VFVRIEKTFRREIGTRGKKSVGISQRAFDRRKRIVGTEKGDHVF
jgi:hypothetical protein